MQVCLGELIEAISRYIQDVHALQRDPLIQVLAVKLPESRFTRLLTPALLPRECNAWVRDIGESRQPPRFAFKKSEDCRFACVNLSTILFLFQPNACAHMRPFAHWIILGCQADCWKQLRGRGGFTSRVELTGFGVWLRSSA